MSLLELNSVSARYGSFQALYDISLCVEEGETYAIIGANGAGKTTLLRTIAGMLTVDDDAVVFDGHSVGQTPAHKRVRMGISLVPEGRWVFPSLTVHENLLVGAHSGRPGTWTAEKVYELFPILPKLRDRQAGKLSGGEQQALAIGRSLMSNPRLILMDEVSLGLAPIVCTELYCAMPAIIEEGTTVLLVEQDVGQALKVADHVACMLEGRLVLQGRPGDFTRDEISNAYFGV